jgi:hypothetical protein
MTRFADRADPLAQRWRCLNACEENRARDAMDQQVDEGRGRGTPSVRAEPIRSSAETAARRAYACAALTGWLASMHGNLDDLDPDYLHPERIAAFVWRVADAMIEAEGR